VGGRAGRVLTRYALRVGPMPYRSQTEALRVSVERLEEALDEQRLRADGLETEIASLRDQLGRARQRYLRARAAKALGWSGAGTFAGILVMVLITAGTRSNVALLAYGAMVGGIFGLLVGLVGEIPPRRT